MTIFEWRKNSTLPANEIYMIIQHVCDLTKTDIILKERDYKLTSEQEHTMNFISERRLNNSEPLQYLFGYTYFYGRKYYVTPDVLIPRFDTETLIEAVKPVIQRKISQLSNGNAKDLRILDLCTGSGCIICSLADDIYFQQKASFFASDISEKAINIAKKNAVDLPIQFIQSDLFENINGTFDIIVSNPPYISRAEMNTLDKEVFDFEPHLALFGGIDGLDIYRKIANHISKHINENSHLFLEIGYTQSAQVASLFNSIFSKYEIIKDIDNKDRVVHLFNN